MTSALERVLVMPCLMRDPFSTEAIENVSFNPRLKRERHNGIAFADLVSGWRNTRRGFGRQFTNIDALILWNQVFTGISHFIGIIVKPLSLGWPTHKLSDVAKIAASRESQ